MPSLEETCLERFFLGPGSIGPIGSVCVSDEDLLDMLGFDNIAAAQRAFVSSLGHITILKPRLSGELAPRRGRVPDYVRILVFLCWMQTTKPAQRGSRDFREMLEKQTGHRFKGTLMRGLNPMWEHLAAYLAADHGIKLDLPDILPHPQIGRTLRMAFPTWRDRAVFRKLRHALPANQLLDPLIVNNKIATTRHLLTESLPSFEYNFDLFNDARKRGGRDYMDTPFWQAWYAIVAEQAALEELELVEGEYGDFELFRKSPLGTRVPLRAPEEAVKFLPKQIGGPIQKGLVPMEDLGFGRYRASADTNTHVLLMHRNKLAECEEGTVRSAAMIGQRWAMVVFNGRAGSAAKSPIRSPSPQEFGWVGGIRIGGGLLGRTPFAPRVVSSRPFETTVRLDGRPTATVPTADGLGLVEGHYSGTASARHGERVREVLLVRQASEVGESRRLAFDPARDISQDEFYHDTAPGPQSAPSPWTGPRTETLAAVVTIGEALYARTARGLPLSDAFDIVRRGLDPLHARPGEWDIIRMFCDAGWFELTHLRNYPARRLLQRRLTCRIIDPNHARLDGPMPLSVTDRLATAAAAAGVRFETHHPASGWSLPRHVLACDDPSRLRTFIATVGLPTTPEGNAITKLKGDTGGVHGYAVIARLEEKHGFFADQTGGPLGDGLFKLERRETFNPFLYRSVVPGLEDETFYSPTLAITAHHLRRTGKAFDFDGAAISSRLPRVALPASWARWVSDMVLCNAGPAFVGGLWRYSYPADTTTASAVGRYMSVARERTRETPWVDLLLGSASGRVRRIYDIRTGKVRTAGGTHDKRA